MRRRNLLAAIGVGSIGALAGCAGATPAGTDADGGEGADPATDWPSGAYADYATTDVEARTADGDLLGTVTAAVAETGDQRRLGLSDAETLPEDAGMLFVFPAPQDSLTFVMREMDFGIDIVYADADGTITSIHHAPEPGPEEDGEDQRYPGRGQFVLEVVYDWTTDHGVSEGDSLEFSLPEE